MVRKQRIPGPEYGVVSITQELVRNAGLRSHPRPTETESHLQVIRGVAVSRLLYLVLTLASYVDCWALIFFTAGRAQSPMTVFHKFKDPVVIAIPFLAHHTSIEKKR